MLSDYETCVYHIYFVPPIPVQCQHSLYLCESCPLRTIATPKHKSFTKVSRKMQFIPFQTSFHNISVKMHHAIFETILMAKNAISYHSYSSHCWLGLVNNQFWAVNNEKPNSCLCLGYSLHGKKGAIAVLSVRSVNIFQFFHFPAARNAIIAIMEDNQHCTDFRSIIKIQICRIYLPFLIFWTSSGLSIPIG